MLHLSLNPGACKTWLLADEKSREAVLVDPVLDYADAYLGALAARKLKLVRIVDTHTHADHVSAGTLLSKKTGAPYAMHASSSVKTLNERLKDGEAIKVGDERLSVLHTPGHTKDSISLVGDRVLLTGDFLFLGEGGAGRTDLLGGDPGEHWDSLQRLRALRDELEVLPGHDYRGNATGRLGDERRRNPRLSARTRGDYVKWLASMQLEPADWMLDVLRANAEGRSDRKGLNIPEGGACCEVRGGAAPGSDEIPTIGVDELAGIVAKGPAAGITVLDVREPQEYVGPLGHVPGAVNLPISQFGMRLGELEPMKAQKLYVICLSGGRSLRATDVLRQAGYAGAVNVGGGMRAWTMAGHPQEFGPAPARA